MKFIYRRLLGLSGSQDKYGNTASPKQPDAQFAYTNVRLTTSIWLGLTICSSKLLLPVGVCWLSRILNEMDGWLELNDGRFDLAYVLTIPSRRSKCSRTCRQALITSFIQFHHQGTLHQLLSSSDEPITPSQTVLLKLLDAQLSSSVYSTSSSKPSPNSFLIPTFLALSGYGIASIKFGKDDARLAKVFEGLVLVSEGLSSIGLAVQTALDRGDDEQTGMSLMVGEMKIELIQPIIGEISSLQL